MNQSHRLPNSVSGDRERIGKYTVEVNTTARARRQWIGQEIGRIPAPDLYLKMQYQEWKCIYCGDGITFDTCALDHVYPLFKGGSHYLYNVAFSCRFCNTSKGHKTLSRFCKNRRFDVDEIRQRMADINQKLHDEIFSDTEDLEMSE